MKLRPTDGRNFEFWFECVEMHSISKGPTVFAMVSVEVSAWSLYLGLKFYL